MRGVMASLKRLSTCAASFTGRGSVIFFDHDAVALGLEIPGMFAAGMLLVGHEDFVAGLHVDAVGDVAVGFGGIAQQGNFVALAADERGERVAELVPRGVSPDGIVLGILLVHLLGRGVAVEDGAQHGRGAGADRAVVQVDLVLGDEELAPHFGPVRVFILIEEGMVGQWRSLFELRKQVARGRRARRRLRWLRWRGNDGGRA